MTPFGLVWPRLALLATFGSVGPFWPFLAPFDPVWPRLTLFGTIWHHLALFDPAWPHLALLGHSSIFTSRYFKVPIRQGVKDSSVWDSTNWCMKGHTSKVDTLIMLTYWIQPEN